MKLSYILLVLCALFFFCYGTCFGQVSVIHFNSEWNADNNFDITVLKDCKKSDVIICHSPDLKDKYKIKSVPTVIVFDEEEEVNDIYSEYTSQDGWDEDALEDIGLMELISEVERLAYELRTARRGSYANFGDTGEELKTYLEELGRSFTQISNNM